MKNMLLGASLLLAALTACKKDPHDHNEQEQITRLILQFQHTTNSADVRTAAFSDLDGEGGNAPTIDTIRLADSSTYRCQLVLINDLKTPIDTISTEVLAEGDEHQFFFTTTGVSLSTAYDDQDSNGDPIGLRTLLTTGAAGTGTYRVVLKHQPEGTKDGNVATGETDVELVFPLELVF